MIVKIDGKLCHGLPSGGNHYRLLDLETGEELSRLGLGYVSMHRLKTWHHEQGDTTVHAYVVQLNWYAIKEDVSSEINAHLNWAAGKIPFYDLGHSGRDWEKDVSRYVRLYLRLQEPTTVRKDDFNLFDIQLVEDANAPFLDGYEVTKFPGKVVNLKWSQAGYLMLRELSDIKTDWEADPDTRPSFFKPKDDDGRTTIQRAINSTREHYEALKLRYAMPTDAWITLIVSNDRIVKSDIAHKLDHIIIHPNV